MSQTIWIVRHGNREDFLDPNWHKNAERPHDPSLSPDGEKQAHEVGLSLQDQPVNRIFASPFLRTMQTASAIAEVLDLPVHLEPGLGETLPGLTEPPSLLGVTERRERFQRLTSAHEPVHQRTYPESEEESFLRTAETIQALADRYPGENLLFVSHASPIAGAVRGLAGLSHKVRVPLCGIFTLVREDGSSDWTLTDQADISHLSDPETSLRHAHIG